MLDKDVMLKTLGLSDVTAVEIEPVSSARPVWALEMPMERSFDRWQEAAQRAAPLGYVALGVGFWFPFESQGNHLDPWWMLVIPAKEPWQAPATAAYGNWNECPPAHVHAALARNWERRFGATIAGMGSDTIEFMVSRPPQKNKRALSLAMEHYLYCPDIVEQGCGTVDNLAAQLKAGLAWRFWWD